MLILNNLKYCQIHVYYPCKVEIRVEHFHYLDQGLTPFQPNEKTSKGWNAIRRNTLGSSSASLNRIGLSDKERVYYVSHTKNKRKIETKVF
jgi:hypothetical protein